MPKTIRSPPNRDQKTTMSDTDLTKIDHDNTSPITQRTKRRRGSPANKEHSEDIKNMMSSWQEKQNRILNKLVSDVAEIKLQNSQIQESNKEIEKALEFISCKYEDMREKIEILESERKTHMAQIAYLDTKVEDLQRVIKKSSIEIRNLPKEKIFNNKKEMCNIVQSTCKLLNVTVAESDIKDVILLKGKGNNNTIVTEFTRNILKDDIIRNARIYNRQNPNKRLSSGDIGLAGESKPIYVSEALTNRSRTLFSLARNVAKSEQYKFCWTSNGKVYIRKTQESSHIEIKDELQLSSIKNVI
ncbi:uncharacterized protein LOC113520970 [Galleria mellonella]|uniref:Uncharacterized protein LOC113520970 n=1 Tax=Galleria mellonella TaxID=7137 RepID=A0A6J1WZZ5_GALME|nr:uncharacterized protein LOC113520970 [Galleria mellonella]